MSFVKNAFFENNIFTNKLGRPRTKNLKAGINAVSTKAKQKARRGYFRIKLKLTHSPLLANYPSKFGSAQFDVRKELACGVSERRANGFERRRTMRFPFIYICKKEK